MRDRFMATVVVIAFALLVGIVVGVEAASAVHHAAAEIEAQITAGMP